MSDRQLAAAGIRKGLEFWPDANHWCQDRLLDVAEDGTQQRCTVQMLCDGMGLSVTCAPIGDYYGISPIFKLAENEIIRVAIARGAGGFYPSVCSVNNNNNFDTVKSIVEEAATNLEKLDEQPQS